MINIKTVKLDNIWITDSRIQKARRMIIPKINKSLAHSKIKFDSQDLEHQILFRMTTFPETEAFQKLDYIFQEQKAIIEERMKSAKVSPEEFFCFGIKRDETSRWYMEWGPNKEELYCVLKKNGKIVERREVFFREITFEREKLLIKDLIENYHYIHCDRCDLKEGMIFGFFLEGRKIPFAVEEVEPCRISRNYKKGILMILNINYHTCAELTRFYSVPNTPKNIVSILDKLVARALREKGYEWIMTSVMPTFAKTRATTIAGGIDKPILAKELRLFFFERPDGLWELCVNRKKERLNNPKIIKNVWKLFPVIEMIKPIKRGLTLNTDKVYFIRHEE